jgi:hypothetical protein
MNRPRWGLLPAALTFYATLAHADSAVTGVIRYGGKAPTPTVVNKGAPPACGTDPVYDESLAVSNGKLANVVVTVEGVPDDKPAPAELALDQKGCRYLPHVQAGPVGSKITIANSDTTLHTAHAYHGANSLYNVATPTAGSKVAKDLTEAGPVRFKCDAGHSWMAAWVFVTDTSHFAVSKDDGSFAIPNVPPGTYTVKAWHETLGERTAKVTVPAGKPAAPLAIDFK